MDGNTASVVFRPRTLQKFFDKPTPLVDMPLQTTKRFTVGDYLAERLAQVGVRHHFVVPGDYNLVLLDKLQAHKDLKEIGCANELNCSLAAEGYARANGVSACVVTFSVGAISAFNGTGSAYAENLPRSRWPKRSPAAQSIYRAQKRHLA